MPGSLPRVLLDVRVRLELGLAQRQETKVNAGLIKVERCRAAVALMQPCHHAHGQALPPLNPDLIHAIEFLYSL